MNTKKKKIFLLGTGGTIAGKGDFGKETGYRPGALSVEDLLAAIPGLSKVADIQFEQFCNINSDDMTGDLLCTLSRHLNILSQDPTIDGFVITHGTDTLEETAYFLNLTVQTSKPIVLTGSMRPSTALSPDGPMNLYQAVCLAADDESRGRGVMVLFSDKIYAARFLTKTSTFSVEAMSGRDWGCMGIVRNDQVFYYSTPTKRHTRNSEFSSLFLTDTDPITLPPVSVISFHVDANPTLLSFAASISKGLVIAGAGAGEFSNAFAEVLQKISLPIVISSRIGSGRIPQDALLCSNTIPGDDLPPQKAALLLRLCLAARKSPEEIAVIFREY